MISMKRTLTALLALLTALLLIRPAAAAARTVPVTVDDALLRETCYLESGSTLVPLRGLLGLLGGWTVSWQSGQAVAVSGSRAIRARPGASSFRTALSMTEAALVQSSSLVCSGSQ